MLTVDMLTVVFFSIVHAVAKTENQIFQKILLCHPLRFWVVLDKASPLIIRNHADDIDVLILEG